MREDRTGGHSAYLFEPQIPGAARAEQGAAAKLLYSRLLGYAMAHKLTHLLGFDHAKGGIMDTSWSRDGRSEIRGGKMHWSRDEAAKPTSRTQLAGD